MDTAKRERLLKAAIKIFARDGFFKAKVEEIAKVAGVATGTTYLYFKNKDDLLISIFEEEMTPIIEKMKIELEKQKSPEDKITTFIKRHCQVVEKNPDLALLLEVELRQSNKFLHEYKGTKFKEYLDLIGNAFEEGQKTGLFQQEVHSSIFKQLVFGAVDQISTNWTLSKSKKVKLADAADQISRVVLNGVKN
ncbi:TetR/AcrR family transcriptional regulator [candidate division KSB1 bacterium]|nr:TetR/AcrR family transcriptional regulator [candidate division KSB1 bacterium]RQW06855.1 MAG: TetR/AcrR family transcriptional regulator [candidate division KSB1 bacterium]